MITWATLTDATNYEFRMGGTSEYDTYTWIEGMDYDLGVMFKVPKEGDTLEVINTETNSGVTLTKSEAIKYARVALHYVQFMEYAEMEEFTFKPLADALLAMGCGYGFTGSDMGLGIALDYGFWLDVEPNHYRIWGENGMDYYAATPAGCATAWKRAMEENAVFTWATNKRKGNA